MLRSYMMDSEQAVWLVRGELLLMLAGVVFLLARQLLLVEAGRGLLTLALEGDLLVGGGASGLSWWSSGVRASCEGGRVVWRLRHGS